MFMSIGINNLDFITRYFTGSLTDCQKKMRSWNQLFPARVYGKIIVEKVLWL